MTTTAIDDAIVDIIATEFGGNNPGYVRQIYYRLVSAGAARRYVGQA